MLPAAPGSWIGFGGWFWCSTGVLASLENAPEHFVLTPYSGDNWRKVGSVWRSDDTAQREITLSFNGGVDGTVAIWSLECGEVSHEYLAGARPELLTNMWDFAPEANFYRAENQGTIRISADSQVVARASRVHLKSCNRCGRLLPVNLVAERVQLSYSNHCTAAHRVPCRHAGFGRIRDETEGGVRQLTYGFQLECRYCKKFEVNAAHNPKRTAAQMKEDAARRRAFELLLDELYAGSPQLRYRMHTGRELTSDIWQKFDRKCFKCGTQLASARDMALDHTRPLALLWPLDSTATALCPTHNSEKRDRSPSEFYTPDELRQLAMITGISLAELQSPSANRDAIDLLGKRIDWFFDDFLSRPELTAIHDNKKTGDLLIKALDKALQKYPGGPPFSMRRNRYR